MWSGGTLSTRTSVFSRSKLEGVRDTTPKPLQCGHPKAVRSYVSRRFAFLCRPHWMVLQIALFLIVIDSTAPVQYPESGAILTTAQLDYHRHCRPKERGGCMHWAGLSCSEVDAILQNVRRFERQACNPVASSPISLAPSSLPPAPNSDTRAHIPQGGKFVCDTLAAQSPRIREQFQRPPPPPLLTPLNETAYLHAVASPAPRTTGLSKPGGGHHMTGHPAAALTQNNPGPLHMQQQHSRKRHDTRASTGDKMEEKLATGGSSTKVASFPVIDTDGHVKYRLGDGLEPSPAFPRGRYKILRSLGSGTYGKVVECWDRQAMAYCAVKVVRAVPKYKKAAELEISVLLQLQGHHGCVRLLRHFEYQGHVCMSFELLGPNLYEIMRACNFRPFSLRHVRRIAAQVVEALCLVHGRSIVHTDVKPENILLVDQVHKKGLVMQDCGVALEHLNVKLVDFGSAVHRTWRHASVVSTRHYRAPEVILQLGWSYPADMWSMGCILVELLTGQVLFGMGQSQSENALAHLAAMHQILGPFPLEMMERARANGMDASLIPQLPQPPNSISSADAGGGRGAGLPGGEWGKCSGKGLGFKGGGGGPGGGHVTIGGFELCCSASVCI